MFTAVPYGYRLTTRMLRILLLIRLANAIHLLSQEKANKARVSRVDITYGKNRTQDTARVSSTGDFCRCMPPNAFTL